MSIQTAPVAGELPSPKSLLPTELFVSIGCVGCQFGAAGNYCATGTREERERAGRDLLAIGDLSGLPVTVQNNSARRKAGDDAAVGACGSSPACQDPEVLSLLKEVGITF